MEDVIRVAVEEALATLGITPVDFVVEHPGDMSHGDYACNVAMVAAKASLQAWPCAGRTARAGAHRRRMRGCPVAW